MAVPKRTVIRSMGCVIALNTQFGVTCLNDAAIAPVLATGTMVPKAYLYASDGKVLRIFMRIWGAVPQV